MRLRLIPFFAIITGLALSNACGPIESTPEEKQNRLIDLVPKKEPPQKDENKKPLKLDKSVKEDDKKLEPIGEPKKLDSDIDKLEEPEKPEDIKKDEPKTEDPKKVFGTRVDNAIYELLPVTLKDYGIFSSPIDDIKNSTLMKDIITDKNKELLSQDLIYPNGSTGTILSYLASKIIEEQAQADRDTWQTYRTKIFTSNRNADYVVEEVANKLRTIIVAKDDKNANTTWLSYLMKPDSNGKKVMSILSSKPVGNTKDALFPDQSEVYRALGVK
jgi:hypothetical protein